MFSSQQLRWRNIRADSGAGMLRQNKPGESAAPRPFPLLGDVCLCVYRLTIRPGAQVRV